MSLRPRDTVVDRPAELHAARVRTGMLAIALHRPPAVAADEGGEGASALGEALADTTGGERA